MRDAIKVVKKDKLDIDATEMDMISIRLENKKYDKCGGFDSIRGTIVPISVESPSEILRKYNAVKESLKNKQRARELIEKHFFERR